MEKTETIEALDEKTIKVTLVPEVITFTFEEIQGNLQVAQNALDTLTVQHAEAEDRMTKERDLWLGRFNEAKPQVEEMRAVRLEELKAIEVDKEVLQTEEV